MKCILLSRVSSERQDLVQQTNELVNEAKRMGYLDWVTIEDKESAICLDENERQGLNKMKETIEDGGIDCVICYEVSRISRRPKVLYSIRDYLIERQIQLVVLKPYMRLLDNDGKMSQTASIMFSLFASLSESEMMIKKERMSRGKKQKQKEGKYIGGYVPYGYKLDSNKRIIVDEETAPIVRSMFDDFIKFKSVTKVAKHHIEIGTFGLILKTAVHSRIWTMLHKSFYAGINPKQPYPAIVKEEVYKKVQAILDTNKRKCNRNTNYYKDKCQALLFRLVWQGNQKYYISGFRNAYFWFSYNYPEKSSSINANILDSLVWNVVKSCNIVEQDIDQTKKNIIRQIEDNKKKIKHSKKRIEDLNRQIDKCEERIIMGKITDKKGELIELQLKSEIEDITIDLNYTENQNVNLRLELLQSDMLLNRKDNSVTQRETIQKCVKRVDVDKLDEYSQNITITMINGLSFKYRSWHNKAGYYRIYNEKNELIKFELLNYCKSRKL